MAISLSFYCPRAGLNFMRLQIGWLNRSQKEKCKNTVTEAWIIVLGPTSLDDPNTYLTVEMTLWAG